MLNASHGVRPGGRVRLLQRDLQAGITYSCNHAPQKAAPRSAQQKTAACRLTVSAARGAVCIAQAAPEVAEAPVERGFLLEQGAEASSSESLSSAEQQRPDWTPAGLRSFSDEQEEAAGRSDTEEPGSAEASEAQPESGVVRRERGGFKARNRREQVPVTDPFFKEGDTVVGRVVSWTENGARVQLLKNKDIFGFMPANQCAVDYQNSHIKRAYLPPDIGQIRQFRVIYMPPDMCYHGKGPIISAHNQDNPLHWFRIQQMYAACREDAENFVVDISAANDAGVIGYLDQIQVFVPVSHLGAGQRERQRSDSRTWLGKEDLEEKYVGKALELAITDVTPPKERCIMSVAQAARNAFRSQLQVGKVVEGTINAVESYGAFVSLGPGENSQWRGLIHISNTSRAHVPSMEVIFTVGERVTCLIIAIDGGDNDRISLSTAELEEADGDMLLDKARVFANAEANAAYFRQAMAAAQGGPLDSGSDFDQPRRSSRCGQF